MEVNKLGEHIGAEVVGVDVRTMSDDEFAVIYRTWLDNNVICVRDQTLEIDQFIDYSRRFGQVIAHPSKSTRHPDHPLLTVLGIDKFRPDGTLDEVVYSRGGHGFHTDGAYDDDPFKATQLYALAVPDQGGDTLFASAYAAHDALPTRLKERLAGRRGAYVYGGRTDQSVALLNPEDRNRPPAMHPILRTHAETGRTALYFDPDKILWIEGLEETESDEIIAELATYMVQPDAGYRHRWCAGDIVIWDNRCSYHKAAADYPPEQDRIHWRTSIKAA